MFKLRLLTAAAAVAFLAGAASAQTPSTPPGADQAAKAGQATQDVQRQSDAAKRAKDEAMRNVPDDTDAQTTAQQPTASQPMPSSQSAQAQPAAQTTQTAEAQQGTSKEGMSERTTRAWSQMDMQETTVGNSRLFTSTATDEAGRQVTTITNGPVPDNAENRAMFKPLSAAGRRTAPRGN